MNLDWLLLTSGWIVGGIGWGMWISDRLWLSRVDWVPRQPDTEPPGVEATYMEPEEVAEAQLLKMDRERWITDTMNEAGVNRTDAESQVDELLAEMGL